MVRPLGHIHFFSAVSMAKALAKSGWEIVLQKNGRPGDISSWEAIKQFNWRSFKDPFRGIRKLFKGLLIEKLVLERDQWFIVAKAQ